MIFCLVLIGRNTGKIKSSIIRNKVNTIDEPFSRANDTKSDTRSSVHWFIVMIHLTVSIIISQSLSHKCVMIFEKKKKITNSPELSNCDKLPEFLSVINYIWPNYLGSSYDIFIFLTWKKYWRLHIRISIREQDFMK
jgi:hypothetical protein